MSGIVAISSWPCHCAEWTGFSRVWREGAGSWAEPLEEWPAVGFCVRRAACSVALLRLCQAPHFEGIPDTRTANSVRTSGGRCSVYYPQEQHPGMASEPGREDSLPVPGPKDQEEGRTQAGTRACALPFSSLIPKEHKTPELRNVTSQWGRAHRRGRLLW